MKGANNSYGCEKWSFSMNENGALRHMTVYLKLYVRSHLIFQLLWESLSLIQREALDHLGGKNMLAAQLINHVRNVEKGMICQELPVFKKAYLISVEQKRALNHHLSIYL